MKVQYHPHIDTMHEDPANYAITAGLVNNHDAWVRTRIGVWRWRGLMNHKDLILDLIRDKYVLDLGGQAAPLGYGSIIVDYNSRIDAPRSLFDVPDQADVVFASHLLEHIVDVEGMVAAIYRKLKPGGVLIAQVPSYHFENLRAENDERHEHTFCLSSDGVEFEAFDGLLADFEMVVCEYLVDKCIFVVARKA